MSADLPSFSYTRILPLSIAASLMLGFAACGGSVNSVDQGNGAGDGGARGDAASNGNGDVRSDACPASVPLPGSPCASAGLTCEYGGEGPYLACSTIATCRADKSWISNGGGAECTALQSENDPACPSSYEALEPGAACPAIHGACVYPEGRCACASCFSPDAGGSAKGWSCVRWPSPTGCPTPRPRIGSSCAVDGQECGYATFCSAVGSGLPDLTCSNGLWQELLRPAPPCALPMCGR